MGPLVLDVPAGKFPPLTIAGSGAIEESCESERMATAQHATDWRQNDGASKLEVMTRTIEELIPDYLRGLPVYVPGKPIEEVERELKIHAVKLASNENPLGPSPKAHCGSASGAWRFEPLSGRRNACCCAKRWQSAAGVSPEEIFDRAGVERDY